MALRSFKDVGVKGFNPNNIRITNPIPIGIKTPLEIDEEGRNLFVMHYDLPNQMDDNLRNLILTNHGERLGLYSFGANLKPLLSEYSNKNDFDNEAMIRINTAIKKYLPFVVPVGFDSTPDLTNNQSTAILKIIMTYSIPIAGITERKIEVELFLI